MSEWMIVPAEDEEYKVEVLAEGDEMSVRILEAVPSAQYDEGERVHGVKRKGNGDLIKLN